VSVIRDSTVFESDEGLSASQRFCTTGLLMGEKNACYIHASLGRPRSRWQDRIFNKWDGGYGVDRSGSGYGQMADSCECDNEPLGSIKCGEFLD
jgi:hypothetical protein